MHNLNVPRKEISLIEKLGAPIWDNIYRVIIRYVDTLKVDDIKNFGLPTVGDSYLDREMHNQPMQLCITINDMVEYFKRGVMIRLVDNQDAERIYNVVNNYLLAWKDRLEKQINIGDAPMEDLLDLDRFATEVYPTAKTYSTYTGPKFSLFNNLHTGNGAFVSRNTLIEKTEPPKDNRNEKHDSLAKIFASNLTKGGW